MNNRRIFPFLVLIFITLQATSIAQETPTYRKNSFNVNVTRFITCEMNFSYERFISIRKSLEFTGGIIYVNSFIEAQAEDWNLSPVFSETGYAARFHYKIYRRQDEVTRWRDYISPGLIFKKLEYDLLYITTEIKPDYVEEENYTYNYTENFIRSRERYKFGVEFLWGKVYDASRVFALEFYYGAGIVFTEFTRIDYSRVAVYLPVTPPRVTPGNKLIPDYKIKKSYVRPVIQLGFKLRLKV
jgi:hypothetical protein